MLPVKVTLRMRRSAISSSLTAAGRSAVITWKTSAGPPTCCPSRASMTAVIGVCSAGLTITEQPAASPGATLRVIIAAGKFHGVIASTGPTG